MNHKPINLTSLPESLRVQFDRTQSESALARAEATSSMTLASSDLARNSPELASILQAATLGKSQIVGTHVKERTVVDEHVLKVFGITVGRDINVRTEYLREIKGMEIR